MNWTLLAEALRISCLFPLSLLLPLTSQASEELDREFALPSISYLRPSGDMGKLGERAFQQAARQTFNSQDRFTAADASVHDHALINGRAPYSELISTPSVLQEILISTRTQSLIRSRLLGTGERFELRLEWLMGKSLQPLIALSRTVSSSGIDSEESRAKMQASLRSLIRKLPWPAQIQRRTGKEIQLDVGQSQGLMPGHFVQISTLEKIQSHAVGRNRLELQGSRTRSRRIGY